MNGTICTLHNETKQDGMNEEHSTNERLAKYTHFRRKEMKAESPRQITRHLYVENVKMGITQIICEAMDRSSLA
jgi:hypothetical protein